MSQVCFFSFLYFLLSLLLLFSSDYDYCILISLCMVQVERHIVDCMYLF